MWNLVNTKSKEFDLTNVILLIYSLVLQHSFVQVDQNTHDTSSKKIRNHHKEERERKAAKS